MQHRQIGVHQQFLLHYASIQSPFQVTIKAGITNFNIISPLILHHIFHCPCCSPMKTPTFTNSYNYRRLNELFLQSSACLRINSTYAFFAFLLPLPSTSDYGSVSLWPLPSLTVSCIKQMAGNPAFGCFT